MKRVLIICLFVFTLFTTTIVYGQEPLQLTIGDAIDIGLKNNFDIILARIHVDDAENMLRRWELVGDEDEIDKARQSLENALESLIAAEENLVINIEQRYYDLLKTLDRVEADRISLEDQIKNYELDKARYNAGLISELSLMRTGNTLMSSKISFENQLESLATQLYRFNELLGLSLQQEVELIEEIEVVYVPVNISLDEAIEFALEHSESVKNAKDALKEAREGVVLADNEYTPPAELDKAIIIEKEAEINLIKAEYRVFFDVRSSYLTLTQREASIQSRERDIDYAERDLAVARARYEAGVISEDDLRSNKNALINAKKNLTDAIWDYISARRDFMRVVGDFENALGGQDNDK